MNRIQQDRINRAWAQLQHAADTVDMGTTSRRLERSIKDERYQRSSLAHARGIILSVIADQLAEDDPNIARDIWGYSDGLIFAIAVAQQLFSSVDILGDSIEAIADGALAFQAAIDDELEEILGEIA